MNTEFSQDQNLPLEMRLARIVFCQIMAMIALRPPESGGILLGPLGCNDVTEFYFDSGAACSGATYSPDTVTLKRKMQEEWLPQGIDMKGFVHSHPCGFDRLSGGDLTYIKRLLARNPDMSCFLAPIVIPEQFRLCPFVVPSAQPQAPRRARLSFF